jgi:hypothetical protein
MLSQPTSAPYIKELLDGDDTGATDIPSALLQLVTRLMKIILKMKLFMLVFRLKLIYLVLCYLTERK